VEESSRRQQRKRTRAGQSNASMNDEIIGGLMRGIQAVPQILLLPLAAFRVATFGACLYVYVYVCVFSLACPQPPPLPRLCIAVPLFPHLVGFGGARP
jgi:hypothetical protein